MDRIPLYLGVMLIALAGMTTNIYNVHKWNLGIVTLEPWRQKLSRDITRVTRVFARCVDVLWPHRQQIAALACAICVLLLAPVETRAHGLAICVVGHLAQLETDLKAKQAEAKTLLEKTMRACADHVVTAATATAPEVKGRLMTPEEKAAIQALLDEAKGIKARIDGAQNDATMLAEIDRLTAGMTERPASGPQATRERRSLGQQFIADPAYRAFITAGGHRSTGMFTSPAVELHATTLDTSAGSGGALVLPDYQPGVIPLLFRRLVVADLLAPGTTTSNLISYMKEKTFTNAAAAVGQGLAKPESTLVYEAATSAVKKIAHWIPVTTEMLDDYAQTQSLIDARLRLGIDLAEEDELLNGDGTGAHLLGLNALPGLSPAVVRGADSNADAIFKQITAISTTVFVTPDGIIMNPINWQTIQLTKNAAGNYLGSGPWAPAQPAQLWGLPVAVTPAEVANSALVGAYRQCAQFFRHGGVRVQSSNSHSDFFTTNKVAILAEERGALAAYREAAFGKVTGLN